MKFIFSTFAICLLAVHMKLKRNTTHRKSKRATEHHTTRADFKPSANTVTSYNALKYLEINDKKYDTLNNFAEIILTCDSELI